MSCYDGLAIGQASLASAWISEAGFTPAPMGVLYSAAVNNSYFCSCSVPSAPSPYSMLGVMDSTAAYQASCSLMAPNPISPFACLVPTPISEAMAPLVQNAINWSVSYLGADMANVDMSVINQPNNSDQNS